MRSDAPRALARRPLSFPFARARRAIGGATTGMILRRVSALGILLSAFVGLGVLSFLGNRVLSGIFIVTALVVIVRRK